MKTLLARLLVAVVVGGFGLLAVMAPSMVRSASAQAVGALDHVTVTPASVSLAPGATQQFAAVAYDASNNVIPGATFTWSVSGGGSINASGLLTAVSVAGAYTNAVQVSAVFNSVTKTSAASFTMTAAAPPSEAPKPMTIGALRSLYNALLHQFGFDHFLGIEAKVLDAQGNPMSIKAVMGKVTAITGTSLTIAPNDGTAAQTYTVSDKTQYIPAAQGNSKGLAGFQVNDKVTIGLISSDVMLVAKAQPQVEQPRPAPTEKQVQKENDQVEQLREQMDKRLDQLESRLDKLMGTMSPSNGKSDSSKSNGNDKLSLSSGENGRGPQFVPPGLAKNQGKQGRGHDKD